MISVTVLIGILSGILLLYILWPKKRPKNFPPGPKGIPLFGNVFQVGAQGHTSVMEMAEKYGPIVGIEFGSYWVVYLNGAELIREAFNRIEFSGRWGYNPILEENVSDQTGGVVMSFGEIWQEERRFCLKTLRDFGLGRRSLESFIQEETKDLLAQLRKMVRVPISTRGLFNANVLNVIWAMIAGERFSHDDERLAELLKFIIEIAEGGFSGIKLLNFLFPTLVRLRKTFMWQLLVPDSMKQLKQTFISFLQKSVDEHRNTIELGNPRDFIDAYLEQFSKKDESGKLLVSPEIDDRLITTLFDLFGAGSETTSTSLSWALFLMAMNPLKQEKLYKEIQSVVGNGTVQLEHRQKLPYAEAMVQEIFRMASLTAAGVPHSTTEDIVFKGYNIPKNTIVFGNLYSAHFAKSWGDPKVFRPERYLSDDEKIFTRNPNVIPFSVGKRQCIGEILARDEFFIFLMNIVQNFKIIFPDGEPQHSANGIVGLVLMPEPHKIMVLDRNT